MSSLIVKLGIAIGVAALSATALLDQYIRFNHKLSLEEYLETRSRSGFKTFCRTIFNSQQKVNSVICRVVNLLRRSEFKVENGGEIDYMLLYPIKAVSQGLKVESWETAVYGLKYDRQYMFAIFDDKKKRYVPVTIKVKTRFSLVKVEYLRDANMFKFTYPLADNINYGTFELPAEINDEFLAQHAAGDVDTTIWMVESDGGILKDVIPQDFYESMDLDPSTVFLYTRGKPCTVNAPKEVNKSTIFQDYYPILLCSTESVEELKERLRKDGKKPYVEASSFRPNIVVKNVKKPFDEDMWDTFEIMSNEEKVRRRCVAPMKCLRCTIPNVKLNEGIIDKKSEATRLISSYRRVDEGAPFHSCFGVYVIPIEDSFRISKGDKIDILLRRSKYVIENPFF